MRAGATNFRGSGWRRCANGSRAPEFAPSIGVGEGRRLQPLAAGLTRKSSRVLFRYRRYFAVLSFLLLATPLFAGLVEPDSAASILKEGRTPAPAPTAPTSAKQLIALPAQVDAYLQDRFGLREKMIRLHKDLTKPVLPGGNSAILVGLDGRLFYLGDEMVLQSAGQVLRERRVTATADTLASIRDALRSRGIRFLVALPPNSSTIYPDDLPSWARNPGKRTEYDLLLDDLADRGVETVDLRPAVKSVRPEGPAYLMYDAHWTARAALAGFNAIAEADLHPDWRLDPKTSLGPPAERRGGDVARILGVQDDVAEKTETLDLPSRGTSQYLSEGPMPDYALTSNKSGPTIMVIGDSFTAGYFPPMLLQHAGRAIWLHHHRCGFDWKWIDKFHPDEVWWAPTERFLLCEPDAYPIDFAATGSGRSVSNGRR